MTNYTAIYSTPSIKNIEYSFKAENDKKAKEFCEVKFNNVTPIIIRNDDQIEEKYFVFAEVNVKGYKEVVYLSKNGIFELGLNKIDLMLFDNSKDAFKYTEDKGYDYADCDKVKNF